MKKDMLFEAVAVLLLIALTFLLYVMVTTNSQPGQWAVRGVIGNQSSDGYGGLFVGDDGIVYTVDGTTIHAITPGGRILWDLTIPSQSADSKFNSWSIESSTMDNGTLYMGLFGPDESAELLAISPTGNVEWNKTYVSCDAISDLSVKNGILYWLLYGDKSSRLVAYFLNGSQAYNVTGTIYYANGNKNLDGSVDYGSFAVDENGTAYVTTYGWTWRDHLPHGWAIGVTAIGQNGSIYWNKNVRNVSGNSIDSGTIKPILYRNDTIYVIYLSQLMALNKNGTLKWNRSYDDTVKVLGPFDRNGKLVLQAGARIFSVSPDGNETTIVDGLDPNVSSGTIDLNDNIIYVIKTVSGIDGSETGFRIQVPNSDPDNWLRQIDSIKADLPLLYNRTLDQLDTKRVYAYELDDGKPLWNYTLPLDKHTAVLSKSNYQDKMPESYDIEHNNNVTPAEWYSAHNITYGARLIDGSSYYLKSISGGILYVYFWTYNYEVPVFPGISNFSYAGGIYALDKNGTMLWSQEPDSWVKEMDARKGTVYYSTSGGGMFSAKADAAAGFALTAAVYLFFRFVLAGAVTRARSRINGNQKRNNVLQFIVDNPGVSMYDISRNLKMNMGTVRYHLMILGINHRITTYRADDKYIRYFTNSGSYSNEQQFIISLIRRGGLSRVLGKLIEKPGLSNAELANELSLLESSTFRQMKELTAKGIVTKQQTEDGRLVYSVKAEFKEQVASAIERSSKITIN